MEKIIIRGCEARGDADKPYLTRWILLRKEKFALYFHKFHRSDADDLHDHPWNFFSFVLWRGYIEEVDKEVFPGVMHKTIKRVWPGMIIYRKATHRHRVILVEGKPAFTLVLRFKYIRWWGFWVKGRFQIFNDYFKNNGC